MSTACIRLEGQSRQLSRPRVLSLAFHRAGPAYEASVAEAPGKLALPFTLLADHDKAAAQAFAVWKEKNLYAKVKARGHTAEVLAKL